MRRDEVQRLLLKPSPQGARKQLGKNRGGQGLEEKRTTTNNAFELLQHHGLSLFSSRQMKDNHETMSPELPQDPKLFSLEGTPPPAPCTQTHEKDPDGCERTRPCGTCNLPTDHPSEQSQTARRVMTRRSHSAPSLFFPLAGRTYKAGIGRFGGTTRVSCPVIEAAQ